MEWIVGFFVGFVADLFRSVFMPATTEWLNRLIPSARRRNNVKDNVLTFEVMERLKSLGKDPNLAKFARDDASQFMNVLTSQQQAFIDNAIEIIDSTHMSQVEMNLEAQRRADVASQQLERAVIALEKSGWLSNSQIAALHDSQEKWLAYAKAHAEFSALEFEGGTIRPLVYSSEMETSAVSRTGELRRAYEDMQGRYD
ncbi:hypothetical protein GCM10011360_00070 [Primorskyibacter flagellatus]|uniref:Lysozyme inhibitor LprI-like N-terminal domain-containing protein n=1 Tax=Primorskyibacter flagellatus TaxID=1387277 RepID=A0A916ZUT3_9RHOB|nr:lysozyme inhibitor LprI family protein [Primorskyibacter flagellatus]GGE15240.1 hypothetical protein GCM10011360_00070 [Primorskyibacter flagellatus]